ncbi:hypothetical protein WEH80_18935 [Actinomycetes bacterium KLBMP 9759]
MYSQIKDVDGRAPPGRERGRRLQDGETFPAAGVGDPLDATRGTQPSEIHIGAVEGITTASARGVDGLLDDDDETKS